jgi:predicted secreted Zn-dependent protease
MQNMKRRAESSSDYEKGPGYFSCPRCSVGWDGKGAGVAIPASRQGKSEMNLGLWSMTSNGGRFGGRTAIFPGYFFLAWAKRQAVYHEIKSARPRLRIISLPKRSSQKDSGLKVSK